MFWVEQPSRGFDVDYRSGGYAAVLTVDGVFCDGYDFISAAWSSEAS